MCHPVIDGVLVKLGEGRTPSCITATPGSVMLVFSDGSEIDLTGQVEWGHDADLAKCALLAKIAVKCGWAKSAERAFGAMKLFPCDFVGNIWPAPPQWGG